MNLHPSLLSLLTACLYVVVFGALSLFRREGLSIQFAFEALGVTVVFVGIPWLFGIALSPILFLALLYLVTMRSRLLVDAANFFARRRRTDIAFRLYGLALAWWPDHASRLVVLCNRGAAEVLSGRLDAAIQTLEGVLGEEQQSRLGFKYEAVSHYNLGLAYERSGHQAQAVREYNEVLDLSPGSPFGQAAQAALNRRKESDQQGQAEERGDNA
jgi:tetratricopeptide (TPR) repeat protein